MFANEFSFHDDLQIFPWTFHDLLPGDPQNRGPVCWFAVVQLSYLLVSACPTSRSLSLSNARSISKGKKGKLEALYTIFRLLGHVSY